MNKKQRERAKELCSMLPLLQHELFTLGLTVTSAHLSLTIEKLGYELCLSDLKEDRSLPQAKKRIEWMRANGQEKEVIKERAAEIRHLEDHLYGKNAHKESVPYRMQK